MFQGEIQDLLTTKEDNFWPGAIDFDETTVIQDDDIIVLQNEEALWQGIAGCLHTPKGRIDGVGLENYGSHLLELRGQPLNGHLVELGKIYIREIIPQLQGYVKDFPVIEIRKPSRENDYDWSARFSMEIYLEVDSVFGYFNRMLYI